jgi:hypothetical protein
MTFQNIDRYEVERECLAVALGRTTGPISDAQRALRLIFEDTVERIQIARKADRIPGITDVFTGVRFPLTWTRKHQGAYEQCIALATLMHACFIAGDRTLSETLIAGDAAIIRDLMHFLVTDADLSLPVGKPFAYTQAEMRRAFEEWDASGEGEKEQTPSPDMPPIPESEDMPLILAWIRPCTTMGQRCERCSVLADFHVDEYEDKAIIEREVAKGGVIIERELEEKLWQATKNEQMRGQYTVHQSYFRCTDHLVQLIKHFLNTPYEKDIRAVLSLVAQGKKTAVQFHFLSHPDLGQLALSDEETPQGFVRMLAREKRVVWKVQE